jgi:hypothetical protein
MRHINPSQTYKLRISEFKFSVKRPFDTCTKYKISTQNIKELNLTSNKTQKPFKGINKLNDWWRVSLHQTQKQQAPFSESESVNELRVTCINSRRVEKQESYSMSSHPDSSEMVMKGRNPSHRCSPIWRLHCKRSFVKIKNKMTVIITLRKIISPIPKRLISTNYMMFFTV